MLAYPQLLDNLNSWLGEVSTSFSSSMDQLDLSSSASLYFILQDKFTNVFLANKMFYTEHSWRPLMDYVSALYDTPLSIDDIDSSVFSKLTSTIDSLEALLKDTYLKLFDKFSNINRYMNNTDEIIDTFLRGRNIWRYPYVNLENQQVG